MKKWFRTRFDSFAGILKFVNNYDLKPGEFQVINDSDLLDYELCYYAEEEFENEYANEPEAGDE